MHYFRVAIRMTLWVVFIAIALSASVAYHMDMPLGRRAGRSIANHAVTNLIAGRLSVGRIDKLTPGRIVLRHVSLYDPHGVRVIQANRIVLVLDLDAAMNGVLRFSHAGLDRGTLRLDQTPEGTITFLDALGARHPATGPRTGPPFHAIVDDMRLHRLVAYGNILGARDLHARDVDVHMRMEFHHEMDIHIFRGHGLVDGPMDFTANLDDVVARVQSEPHEGSTVDANLHYQDQRLRVHMTYAVPRNLPETAPPELDLQLEAAPVDMQTLAEIGFDWAAIFHGRGRGFVRLHGPPTSLVLAAALHHQAGDIVLHGNLPSEGDVSIQASTHSIDLAQLIPNTPSIALGGNIALTVHPPTTGQPSTVHAELNAFAYEGFAIPTLTLDASLLPDRVQIDSVVAPYGSGGHLTADGYANYDGSMHVEVEGSLGDIRNDPNVQRYVPGAHGRANVRASVDRHDEVTTVLARGTLTDLAYSDVLASSLRFDVDSRTHGDASRLRLESSASDLRLGPIMLGDGDASVRSSHGGYAIEGSFYDPRVDGRTAVTGTLRQRGDTQIVDAPLLRYERRGVHLVLRGNHVEFSPHHAFIADHLELTIDDSVAARFDARWAARGADAGQLIVDQLPLAALTRLFTPLVPELDGTFTGRAVLSGDLETDPRVDLRGNISAGRVRTLRGIEGELTALLEHGDIHGGLSLDASEGGHMDIDLTGHAPITLPNFGTAVREGEYHFHAAMESIDIGRLAAGLLGMSDAGVDGCMDGTMDFGGFIAFAPTFDAELSVGDLEIAGSPPVEVALVSRYDGQNLETTASVGADSTVRTSAPRVGRCSEQAAARLRDAASFHTEGLAEAYGSMRVPLVELFSSSDSFSSLLQLMPWGLSVHVPPREFGTLPETWLARIPAALREYQGAASLTALGGFGAVQASAAATLDYVGDTRRLPCASNSRPRLSMWGTHVAGDTRGRLFAFVGSERILSAVARTSLPIDDWLSTGVIGELPETSVDMAITPVEYESLERGGDTPPVESSHVPYLCEFFTGPFAGRVSVEHLFTDHPTLGGSAASEHLQIRRIERSTRGTIRNVLDDSPEIPVIALKFEGDSDRLTFNHDMRWWGEDQVTQVQGFVGWTWNEANPIPIVADDAPFDATLDAPGLEGSSSSDAEDEAEPTNATTEPNQSVDAGSETQAPDAESTSATSEEDDPPRGRSIMPLQLLTAWIPLFGRVDGSMDALVHAHGTLDAPVFDGRLSIRDGTIVLASVGQRLRNVRGSILLDESGAYIRSLTARDDDGTISAHGVIDLRGWDATGFDITAEADRFPVRDEGSIIARLTGRAGLNGTIGDDDVASELTVDSLDVQMVPQTSQNPIGLGEHPDVRIVGLAAAPEVVERTYPMEVHIAQTPRFWVRSEDFSAQVSTELTIIYASPEVRIAGSLEIHRGFFDVFGKRFEVEQGSMVFDGSPQIDPQVSLVARHQLRGGGRNDIVVVHAGGTLTAPVVEFTSPLVSSGDQGQILCLLLTGNSSGDCGQSSAPPGAPSTTTSTAGTQAAQFLTSVAFGVATLALREQFGEFIPMLAVENGTNGSNIPRVRAGFNADRLIPPALRNVVRGIYIEGYYNAGANAPSGAASSTSTTQTNNTSLNSVAGFSIELQFPHNIVSEGEYSLPNNWRIGVTWEP